MWANFTKALNVSSSSIQVTVINSATNFCLTVSLPKKKKKKKKKYFYFIFILFILFLFYFILFILLYIKNKK